MKNKNNLGIKNKKIIKNISFAALKTLFNPRNLYAKCIKIDFKGFTKFAYLFLEKTVQK